MADIPLHQAPRRVDEPPPRPKPQYAGLFIPPPDLPSVDEDE